MMREPIKLAVFVDELTIRLVVKENLCDAGNSVGIDDAEEDGSDDGIENCSNEMTTHNRCPFQAR